MHGPGETLLTTDACSGSLFSGRETRDRGRDMGRGDRYLGHSFPESHDEVGLLSGLVPPKENRDNC